MGGKVSVTDVFVCEFVCEFVCVCVCEFVCEFVCVFVSCRLIVLRAEFLGRHFR